MNQTTTIPTGTRNILVHRVLASLRRGAHLGWLAGSYSLFILVWNFAAGTLDNPVLLPGFNTVVWTFFRLLGDGTLLPDVGASLQRVFLGFLIASATAVPLALWMSYSSTARKLGQPIITLLRPIPPIAWIPIAILWFGIGNTASYFITALAAFFPIFLNSLAGGLAVEARHIHAAKFMGAQRKALLLRIFLPSALPQIWTGLKIGLGQSWMAVVTAELVAAQSGLGYMIQTNRINLETEAVLVGMVTIGILGSLMTWALVSIERFVLPWRPQGSQ